MALNQNDKLGNPLASAKPDDGAPELDQAAFAPEFKAASEAPELDYDVEAPECRRSRSYPQLVSTVRPK